MAKNYCIDYGLLDSSLAEKLDKARGGSGKAGNVVEGKGRGSASSNIKIEDKEEDDKKKKQKKEKSRVISDIGGDSGFTTGGGMGYEYASGGVSMGIE